jgi:phenylpropionate dioxygenase-like ring-hydroxylating dioxygenase large terminal subunit
MGNKINQTMSSLPPNPSGINLAASWYIAVSSAELGARPRALELFGLPLVAWRDGAGQPVVMPRYCPHQGASLALGKVVDGCLRCPFHHWRFAASGACVDIPGAERVPATAHRLPYPTIERYGYIWVWYGGTEPMFELPDFPALEAGRREYIGFRFSDSTTGTVRQLLENAVDHRHFSALHGLSLESTRFRFLRDQAEARDNGPEICDDAWFGAWFEGTMKMWSPFDSPLEWVRSTVATFASGTQFQLLVDGWPGGQRFTAYIDGQEIYKVLLGITPTAERQTTQRGWALVKKTDKRWKTLFYFLLFYAQNRGGTAQDIPIYNTTAAGGNNIYVKYDNGVLRFRKYYQWWVDRVDPVLARSGELS